MAILTKTTVSHISAIYQGFQHNFLFIILPRVYFSLFRVYYGMDRQSVVTTVNRTNSNLQATDFTNTHKADSPIG